MIYIFDIDGTLADLSHRLHFIQKEPKDWSAFYAHCTCDVPIFPVIDLARVLALEPENRIILVSGRSSECEAKTLEWLQNNRVPFTELYMRREGDHRHDNIVKAEILDEVMEDWREWLPIMGVFEDRKSVVEMYRAKGLTVYQVAEGNF